MAGDRSGVRRLRGAAALAAASVAVAPLASGGGAAASVRQAVPSNGLRVVGNQIVDGPGAGRPVQLRGVNRDGLEYACIQGWGFFDSDDPDKPDTPAMVDAMKRWAINVVRVPLNEDCWLGVNTPKGRGGAPYRSIVQAYVALLRNKGLYVILDLHVAAPGQTKAVGEDRMADADHAPRFWKSVARTFRRDHGLIFDLYNEPNHISWKCWLRGCTIASYDDGYGRQPRYKAAGMQQLVDAVRSTGATQPLLLGGTGYAGNLGGWLTHAPKDPLHELIADQHAYGGDGGVAPCLDACLDTVLATQGRVPVLFGELGENDCAHGYIDSMFPKLDSHGIGYLGWAWNVVKPGGYQCKAGPALLKGYDGTPTEFGVGYRDHFRQLAAASR